MRRIIRKSKEFTVRNPNATTNSTSTEVGEFISPSNTSASNGADSQVSSNIDVASSGADLLYYNQYSVKQDPRLEEQSIIGAAWSEQIGSLLDLISEKEGEEWEITEAPQS
jgi:hypothetical protein